jgi:hypothetical protein
MPHVYVLQDLNRDDQRVDSGARIETRRVLGEPLDSTVNCVKKAEPDLTGFEGIELRIVHVRFG